MDTKEFWRPALAYLGILAAIFYLLPLLSMAAGNSDASMILSIFILMILNPAACLVCCLSRGLRHGANWLFPALCVTLFVPTAFIYYNYTALGYVPAYLVCAYLGEGIGFLGARRRRKNQQGAGNE